MRDGHRRQRARRSLKGLSFREALRGKQALEIVVQQSPSVVTRQSGCVGDPLSFALEFGWREPKLGDGGVIEVWT